MFTWLLAVGAQNRIDQKVYELPLLVSGILGVLNFAAFFYLIDQVSRLLRPITVLSNVAFGSERTMEQDPTFPFRIVIDIALKALSPAINDPTTEVLAIDQLHRMAPTRSRMRRAHCELFSVLQM